MARRGGVPTGDGQKMLYSDITNVGTVVFLLDLGSRGGTVTGNGQEHWYSDMTGRSYGLLTGNGQSDCVLMESGFKGIIKDDVVI